MFKTPYNSVRKREFPMPEWAIEVQKKMLNHGISKTELAQMLNINYALLCATLSGSRVSPKTQQRILTKIEELERRAPC